MQIIYIYVQCIFAGRASHTQLDNMYMGKYDAKFPAHISLNNTLVSIVFWFIGNIFLSIFNDTTGAG